MVMSDGFNLYGCFGASLFGFVLVYKYYLRRTKPAGKHDECIKSSTSGGDADDIIIVGAGVAGAALAYTLGKDGRRVHVIERDLTKPHRIVGEHLLPAGYLNLIELGLQVTQTGDRAGQYVPPAKKKSS
ncbi:squalene epoxidase 2 [Perilla frutescens var. hirtella]|uniref:Squalene monooxygenase n=1 Tax=Perilla frutescens var. hirtella TaxID=608512 RepID=A0AAD4IXZ9_PERFH|nr:squalene epoxidase 2 [Perilla frutescens var. hirtella]